MTDEQLMQDAYDAISVAFAGRQGVAEWEQNKTLRAALRERLAQPIASEQEPLGQVVTNTKGEMTFCKSQPYWDTAVSVVNVYTHPAPAQQPLNRVQILDLYEETDPLCSLFTFRDIVADVEAEHNIKDKP